MDDNRTELAKKFQPRAGASRWGCLTFQGVQDIRTIVDRGFPVSAMARLPRRGSDGKANLHPGAAGAPTPFACESGSAPGVLMLPASLRDQRGQDVHVGPADREAGVPMKLAIELSNEQANRLREGADRLGVAPEQLALAAVMDLIAFEGPVPQPTAHQTTPGTRRSRSR